MSYALSTIAAANAVGAVLEVERFDERATQDSLLARIRNLNSDDACHGIVLQLPLPPHLDACSLLPEIAESKDVDGLRATFDRRRLLRAEPTAGPCIAAACEEVLRSLDILQMAPSTPSKPAPPRAPPNVLLLSVPPFLAFPLALCLEAAGCHVSCLADDEDVGAVRASLSEADVLLIGARRPDVVAAQWVPTGCVLLDLGLSTSAAPTPLDLHEASSSDESSGTESPKDEGTDSPKEPTVQQRDVLCLCCSDGLSAMTAALRMRNLSHMALLHQGFLEPLEPAMESKAQSLLSGTEGRLTHG